MNKTYYCPVLARLTAVSVWTKGKYLLSRLSKPETCFYNGNDQNHAYRDLKTASERLFERKIRLQLDNGKELLTRFVQSVIFDPEAGAVNIRFATDIYPYLSELEKNFTKYRLANIVQLTSVYAVRLYELLICWLGQGLHNKEFDIDEFRRLMGADDKYTQFGQLKERVIVPALEQINEFTDHEIRVSYRKVGQYSASLLSVSTLRTLKKPKIGGSTTKKRNAPNKLKTPKMNVMTKQSICLPR